MKLKNLKLFRGFTRFRLLLTLGLAVVLPAAALIFLNFSQLRSFQRDKVLQASIHRDFQEFLAITEKRINKKAYGMIEEVREQFPSPDLPPQEREKQLGQILAKNPWLAHIMFCDEKSFVIHTQPGQMGDKNIRDEHDHMAQSYKKWWDGDGKSLVANLHKKPRPITFSYGMMKRGASDVYMSTAVFVLPRLPRERVVLGAITFDPSYLKQTFFPEMLAESLNQRVYEQSGNSFALIVYPGDYDSGHEVKPLALLGDLQ